MILLTIVKEVLKDTDLNSPHEISDFIYKNYELDEEIIKNMLDQQIQVHLNSLRYKLSTPGQRLNGQSKWGKMPAIFRQPVCLTAGNWKALGDCTLDEIYAVANNRRIMAKSLSQNADKFDDLASTMKRKKVKKVSQLDPIEVEQILEGTE